MHSTCVALMAFREVTTSEESQLEELGKLNNGKAAGKDEIAGEIKVGGNRVVDLIWRLCNMAFESGDMPEDWRSAMIVPLYEGKERRLNVRTIEVLAF